MVATEGDPRIAIRAMKLGAQDYLLERDLTPELLQSAIACGMEKARLQLQLNDDRAARTIATIEDITDRKQAELALQASEQRYRVLIDITTQIVWNADADDRQEARRNSRRQSYARISDRRDLKTFWQNWENIVLLEFLIVTVI